MEVELDDQAAACGAAQRQKTRAHAVAPARGRRTRISWGSVGGQKPRRMRRAARPGSFRGRMTSRGPGGWSMRRRTADADSRRRFGRTGAV